MVLQQHDNYCNKCVKQYTSYKWCKPCQIDNLKGNFTTSKNKKIDNLIQDMRLKIDSPLDIVFEWIPYNQFSDIEEIGQGFATLYSAIWKDGLLEYDKYNEEYTRESNYKIVALKYLHNSQNIGDEFLNEVYMKVL